MSKLDMLTPENSALALIDYQPAMYQGVQSHDRLVVMNNVQVLALDMLKEGYEIYIPADACGDISLEAHNRAIDRSVQAGAIPVTSLQYVFELQQDWARAAT